MYIYNIYIYDMCLVYPINPSCWAYVYLVDFGGPT